MSDKIRTLIALDRETSKEFHLKKRSKNSFVYDNRGCDIQIMKSEDGIDFIELNGKYYSVELVSRNQNEYELLVNGISYTYSIESPFSLERLKNITLQKKQSSLIRIKAPMPGKILEVLVKAGDMVKAGDTLLILEAMKMQNAILASTKAVVKKVLVKNGASTSKSELLIELEREV